MFRNYVKLKLSTPHPSEIKLSGYPALMEETFALLKKSNTRYFALFGGAVRDADYAAHYRQKRDIKDYDLRVWLPKENYSKHLHAFLINLSHHSGKKIVETPSPGTDKIRYCLNYKGVELDISVRPIPDIYEHKVIPIESVAIDRASDSDAGLCSIAIDPQGRAFARPEYNLDRNNKTLTIYQNDNLNRIVPYAKRIKQKFSDHEFVWLIEDNFLEANRHSYAEMQAEYDKRFGLIKLKKFF